MRRCMACKAEWDGAGVLPVECPVCRSTNTAPVVALSGRIRLLDGRMGEIGQDPTDGLQGQPLSMWERFRATLQSERSGTSVKLLVATAAALLLVGVVYAVVR